MSNPFKNMFTRQFSAIAEINRKYAVPKVPMTKTVKWVLLILRLYLLLLVALLVYRFIDLVR